MMMILAGNNRRNAARIQIMLPSELRCVVKFVPVARRRNSVITPFLSRMLFDRHLAHIFIRRDPSAIGWFIIAIVVNPVNCETRRPTISEGPLAERLIGFPRWINLNAAPAVVSIIAIARIIATVSHVIPRAVQAGASISVGKTSSACSFSPQATTRSCEAFIQSLIWDVNNSPTIA